MLFYKGILMYAQDILRFTGILCVYGNGLGV